MNKYFVGFELPAELRHHLVQAQEGVRSLLAPTTRVLASEDFHITCLFLGSMPLGSASEAVDLAWGFGRICFRFDGCAVFENKKGPHALVLKLHDMYGNALLMRRMVTAAAPCIVGHAFPFNPHITLAKCEGPSDHGLTSAQALIDGTMSHHVLGYQFTCDHLCLFEKAEGQKSYTAHRVLQLR